MKKCDCCVVEHITIKCDVIANDRKVFEDADLCFDCRTTMRLAGSQVIHKESVV